MADECRPSHRIRTSCPRCGQFSRIYDSPWPLPFQRRNEIAVPVDGIGESPDELGRPAQHRTARRRSGQRAIMPVASRWNRASFRTRPFAGRQHRYVAYRSGAYCQYTETPTVVGAVSQVVVAVVAENERGTQVLGPAVPMTLVSFAQSGTTVTIGGITREI